MESRRDERKASAALSNTEHLGRLGPLSLFVRCARAARGLRLSLGQADWRQLAHEVGRRNGDGLGVAGEGNRSSGFKHETRRDGIGGWVDCSRAGLAGGQWMLAGEVGG